MEEKTVVCGAIEFEELMLKVLICRLADELGEATSEYAAEVSSRIEELTELRNVSGADEFDRCMKAVKRNPLELYNMTVQPGEIAFEAVKAQPLCLALVRDQSWMPINAYVQALRSAHETILMFDPASLQRIIAEIRKYHPELLQNYAKVPMPGAGLLCDVVWAVDRGEDMRRWLFDFVQEYLDLINDLEAIIATHKCARAPIEQKKSQSSEILIPKLHLFEKEEQAPKSREPQPGDLGAMQDLLGAIRDAKVNGAPATFAQTYQQAIYTVNKDADLDRGRVDELKEPLKRALRFFPSIRGRKTGKLEKYRILLDSVYTC